MTVRQSIVEALVLRLQGITVAGGYHSDAGLNVYEFPPENLAVPGAPCIIVADIDEEIGLLNVNQIEHTLTISVEGQAVHVPTVDYQGNVTQDEDTIGAVRDLLGDIVLVVLGPDDRTLGGICDSLHPLRGGSIKLEQRAEDVVAAVAISFEAKYRTNRGNWSTKIT